MRLLDRYLIREFLTPLAACLGGFLIFWVAFDLFGELEMLQRERASIAGAAMLYVIRLPQLMTTILPVGTLLALLYAITQHARRNELTAMRAAGLSLWRICVPYYVAGVVLSGALHLLNEVLYPDAKEREDALRSAWAHPGASPSELAWRPNLRFFDQATRRSWAAAAFNTASSELSKPRVGWFLPEDGHYEITAEGGQWVSATRGQWTNGYWRLTNAVETFYRSSGDDHPFRRSWRILKPDQFGPGFGGMQRWIFSGQAWTNLWRTNLTAPPEQGPWTVRILNTTNGEFAGLRGEFKVGREARGMLMAERAVWTNGGWTFQGEGHEFLWRNKADNDPIDIAFEDRPAPELTESPDLFRSEAMVSAHLGQNRLAKKPELSSGQVRNYLRLHPNLKPKDEALLRTQWAARLAAPWTCLVVAIIAVPFGAPSGRRNIFYGVAGSIALAFSFFVIQRISFALGQRGAMDPLVAAWLPNGFFALLGLGLTARVR
jgi:lipopolysaccharide export LptBFGC system permease protein LptF